MSACTFFGHRQCHELDGNCIYKAVERLILQGVDVFFVGNQGEFDAKVYKCLKQLREKYSHIQCAVVLAYLSKEKEKDCLDTMLPEEVDGIPPKYAIDRRNKWMVEKSEWVICYVRVPWGGAYKFAELARKRGKQAVNLCPGGVKFTDTGNI